MKEYANLDPALTYLIKIYTLKMLPTTGEHKEFLAFEENKLKATNLLLKNEKEK